MTSPDADVVVGAGPAGTTAALLLARAGIRVILLDKTDGKTEKVCGGGLLRGTLRELHHLDLLKSAIGAEAPAPRGTRISAPNGQVAHLTFPVQQGTPGFLRIVRRAQFDGQLRNCACQAGASFCLVAGHSI